MSRTALDRTGLNRRIAGLLLAAAVVGGVGVVIVPQHAASISRVLAVAVVVVTGGLLLGAVGPFVTREPVRSALDALPATGAPPLDPHGLRDARRDLDRPAAPGCLPPPVRERLLVASRMRLRSMGIDLDASGGTPVLTPATRALLAARQPAGFDRDRAGAAALVHRTLDELDSLDGPTGAPHGSS